MRFIYFLSIIAFLISCKGSEEDSQNNTGSSVETDTTVLVTEDVTTSNKTVEYHPNGNIKMEGQLNEIGERDGLWIAYYEDGTKWSESYYINGIRDGHSLSFFPNGQVRYIGEYRNDEKVGTWKFYNEDGSLATEETF